MARHAFSRMVPRTLAAWRTRLRKRQRGASPRRVPVLLQLTAVECGAACLAMILSALGRSTRVSECRATCGADNSGVTALTIVQSARAFGVEAKAYRVEARHLDNLSLPAIAHWGGNHFVVVEHWSPKQVDIVDPAVGRRRIEMDEFADEFTGVVLTFMPGPTFTPRRSALHASWRSQLWRLLRAPGARSLLAWIIAASLLLQLFGLALPLFVALVVDQVVPLRQVGAIGWVGLGMLLVVLAEALLVYARSTLLTVLQTRLDATLMRGFLEHLLSLPFRFFQERTSGDLLMRLGSNTTIRETLTSQVLATILDGGLALVYLVIVLFQAPLFGVLVLAIGLLQAILLLGLGPRLRAVAEQGLQAQSDEESYLVEALNGIATIKASGAEGQTLSYWSELFTRALQLGRKRGLLLARVEGILTALRTVAPLALLWVGTQAVLAGTMQPGTMLALVVLSVSILAPLGTLVSQTQSLQLTSIHLDRLADIMEAEPEQDVSGREQVDSLTGRIELEHVGFRYALHAPLVLRDLNVAIAPGQHVAIVGRSGSGKSTLAKLLLGLYPPTEGHIVYDGIALERIDLRSLRHQLGVVLQEIFLFSGTIQQNIAGHNPEASDEQVIAAARLAGIHDEIMKMPSGYRERVAEGGSALSGGQRQRIALARALVGKPPILLLDEATSHLDAVTERLVNEHLHTLDCTRIVIAHRLSTIRDADLILVLEDGALVERGTHEELMERGGTYAALVHGQLDHEVGR